MIKFHNRPSKIGFESAVTIDTLKGNYIDARGDQLQIIAVDFYTCASDYEKALPGYIVSEIQEMSGLLNQPLDKQFMSVIMTARRE